MRIVIAGGTRVSWQPAGGTYAEEGHDVRVLTAALPPGEAQHESGHRHAGHHPRRLETRRPDRAAGRGARRRRCGHQPRRRLDRRRSAGRRSASSAPRQPHPRDPQPRGGASAEAAAPPRVFISGSAVGYYGDRGDEPLTEVSPAGDDFLAHLCVGLGSRSTARRARRHARRAAPHRASSSRDRGGALPQMMRPFRFFAGGPIGSGRQYMPWMHRLDWIEMVRWIVADAGGRGPVNVTAPHPGDQPRVRSARSAARMHRPALLPAPGSR